MRSEICAAASHQDLEARWAVEQERIAQAVIDMDDTVWLLQQLHDCGGDGAPGDAPEDEGVDAAAKQQGGDSVTTTTPAPTPTTRAPSHFTEDDSSGNNNNNDEDRSSGGGSLLLKTHDDDQPRSSQSQQQQQQQANLFSPATKAKMMSSSLIIEEQASGETAKSSPPPPPLPSLREKTPLPPTNIKTFSAAQETHSSGDTVSASCIISHDLDTAIAATRLSSSSSPSRPQPRPLRLVGGVDISFIKGSDENACATLVILEYPSLQTVYEVHSRVTMPLPYISGFLAFREVDHLVELVNRLRTERPDLEPDVTFVDGNGRLHPRRAGLACHLGVLTGLRTVGIGKTFLQVDGLTKHGVREKVNAMSSEGERETQLVGSSGTVWGTALLPKTKEEEEEKQNEKRSKYGVVTCPVFVSVGHRTSLETCVALTKAVGR